MLKEIEIAFKGYIETVEKLISLMKENYQNIYNVTTIHLANQYLEDIDELHEEKRFLEKRLREVKIEQSNLSLG